MHRPFVLTTHSEPASYCFVSQQDSHDLLDTNPFPRIYKYFIKCTNTSESRPVLFCLPCGLALSLFLTLQLPECGQVM